MRQVTRVTVLLLLGTLSLAKTTQPVFIESYEGQEVSIPCNHTKIATNEYIHWYRQFPNQGPQFVIQGYKTNVENEVASLFISADRTSSTLSLPRAALRDTAVYYCTVIHGYGNNRLTFGKGTQVMVTPAIQNPDPAVYQLKSPESSNISVCLFTDFDSEVNVNPSTESNMIRLKSTSLDMKTMDSKSNGALAWSNSFDLGCNSTFNYTFHSSSEFPCDANVVEKGFETDMNLNFDNLTVIMFRIIFLKAVGFNLLMTLKLWSS